MQTELNKPLQPLNTFKVEVFAQEYIEINNKEDILIVIKEGIFKKKFFILAGGSNTLFTKNFDGVVLKINIKGIEIIKEENNIKYIKVSAGEDWINFVKWSIDRNLAGLQNLAQIPGLVGSTPVQNVGAYGCEIKDVLEEVEYIDLQTSQIQTIKGKDCKFGYRDSIFKNELKNKVLITSITLKLEKVAEEETLPDAYFQYNDIAKYFQEKSTLPHTLQNLYKAICDIRKSKLPSIEEYGSAGSTFKNPIISKDKYNQLKNKYSELPSYDTNIPEHVKIPAAYILEKLGWKNKRVGECGTWIHHPLIVTNYGKATGEEILNLIQTMRKDFFEDTGIQLDTEINII